MKQRETSLLIPQKQYQLPFQDETPESPKPNPLKVRKELKVTSRVHLKQALLSLLHPSHPATRAVCLQWSNPARQEKWLWEHHTSTGQPTHVIPSAAIPGQNTKLVHQKDLWTVSGFDSMLSDPFDKHIDIAFQATDFTSLCVTEAGLYLKCNF